MTKTAELKERFEKKFWADKDNDDRVAHWLATNGVVHEGQQMHKIATPDDVFAFLLQELQTQRESDLRWMREKIQSIRGYGNGNLVPREKVLQRLSALTPLGME